MDPTARQPDTRPSLDQLADIVTPLPVSWWPQTWGWGLVAVILLTLAAFVFLRWLRRFRANRYRREALADLAELEEQLADEATRADALAAMPELLKRVALAAWPRRTVASLTGKAWLAFLREHDARQSFDVSAARLLDDLEYRSRTSLGSIDETEARRFASCARRWIEGHVVSA
ncbi:MAG TPA: DUF4381 domain-containing protein [Rhizobiaceae bacterium]|nr:DUF4381 domain-containing protein [Rhizobiaceae bacterium]